MEGQGDLFEPEYLTYRPCSATETRKHVTERLQPIVDELKRHKANPLAVAEGFHFFASQFRAQAEREILEAE